MRQPGFYWIKMWGEWTIGEWTKDGEWYIIGSEQSYEESHIDLIGERVKL